MNTQRLVDLWRKLRDRRIIQIFTAYLAGGWIALEVIGALVERAILPELAYRLGLVIFLAGIPASLIIGWYHGEKGDQKVSVLELALLGVVLLGAVGGSAAVIDAHTKESLSELSEMDLRRIAVLYFENASSDEELLAVADGLTDALIERLGRVPTLDVVSRNGSARFRDSDLPPDSIARVLEAGTLITGSLDRRGERLRATLRLIDGSSGADIERQSLEWAGDDLLAGRTQLAEEASRLLRRWLGEEVRLRERRADTESTVAWVLVQRAEREESRAEADLDHERPEEAMRAYRAADSLLAEAAALDTAWAEPLILRGHVAHEMTWLAHDADQAATWVEEGMRHVEEALQRFSDSPEALAVRGRLRYRLWLLGIAHDPAERRALFEAAREDLEVAVAADPTLASAHSALSHLYYQGQGRDDLVSAVLAARRAYEQDAYVRAADGLIWRMYSGHYDLDQYREARRWCEEGRERFPAEFRFVECQLWLMTMGEAPPDVDRAWSLLADMEPLVPPPIRELQMRRARMIVGGILGRAGLSDSADRVLERARADPGLDPHRELLAIEAAMRVLGGDHEEALSLVHRYEAANPGHFEEGTAGWWWDDLQRYTEFQRLTGEVEH